MKNTAKITLSLLAILVMTTFVPLNAQGPDGRGKRPADQAEWSAKMKSMKIAFITEHLELTAEEAEKFWPLYNDYEKKREEIARNIFTRFATEEDAAETPDITSDEEADRIIRQRFSEEQALLDLKEKYYEEFLKVIPASRILKLHNVEHRFKRHLLERARGGQEDRQSPRPASKGKPQPEKDR